MAETSVVLRFGTRGSALARWQTEHVAALLEAAWPGLRAEIEVIQTQGDRVVDMPLPLIGGKGLFTAELETALRSGAIDVAVHSLKDLPTENPPGLTIGATPRRATPNDALVSGGGHTLATLPPGAAIGTSSRRRAAQLLCYRPDFNIVNIRGNVDTRIRKALDPDGSYDAIVLASAGLERLERQDVITEWIPLDVMLPAPGQAAVAAQCSVDSNAMRLLDAIDHRETRIAVTAERAFLAGLGGGCTLPIAAFASIDGDRLMLRGRVNAPDGSEQIETSLDGPATLQDALALGNELAQMALSRGVARLLEMAR